MYKKFYILSKGQRARQVKTNICIQLHVEDLNKIIMYQGLTYFMVGQPNASETASWASEFFC